MLKCLVPLILLGICAAQEQPQSPCLILKYHQKTAGEALMRWTVAKPFNYVEGDFPKGMKFRWELNDKHIRKIKDAGVKVIILKSDYTQAELQDARDQCKESHGPK